MKILIVEDENLLARELIQLLHEIEPAAEVIGRTISISGTVEWLSGNERPDLILMDIELGDGQCFEIFRQVKISTPVIFTTAYDEYALKAFKVNSIDYLLKPVSKPELRKALDKYSEPHQGKEGTLMQSLQELSRQLQGTTASRERFLVKQGQKMITIQVTEVAMFNSRNSITWLITREKKQFVLDYTLDEIEEMVSPAAFFRVNRKFILRQELVMSFEPWFNGKLKVSYQVQPAEDIIISREKAASFRKWMGE